MVYNLNAIDRLEEYHSVLVSVYGKNVVESVIDRVNEASIKLKGHQALNGFISNYERSEREACQVCKDLMEKSFRKRKMDFPSWLGSLDFKKTNAKQIMIISEDVSPIIDGDIGVTYGLGRYEINASGEVEAEREKRNHLWIFINRMFGGKLQVTENVYVTDICKCNARKRRKIWNRCSTAFLKKEIELINPKIIIFQGATSYEYAKSILGSNMREEDISFYFHNNTFPKFGRIILPTAQEIVFLKMYHTSIANPNRKRNFEYAKLVKEKILPLIV